MSETPPVTRVDDAVRYLTIEVTRCCCGAITMVELPHAWACIKCGLTVEKRAAEESERETSNPDCEEMVLAYLKEHGFGGLYHPDGDCACLVDDLIPCGGDWVGDCIAGYSVPCDGTCEDGSCDYHIAATKPPRS